MMKKLLSILTLSVLPGTVITQNCNFLPEVTNVNEPTMINQVSDSFKAVGTIANGASTGIAITSDGTIWAAVKNQSGGKIYKKTTNQNNFTEVLTTKYFTAQIVVAGNDNLWIGTGDDNSNGEVFVKHAGQDQFTKVEGITGSVSSLTMSQDGSVWVGTKAIIIGNEITSVLYHNAPNSEKFIAVDKVTGIISALTTFRNHIWVGVQNDKNSADQPGQLYRKSTWDSNLHKIADLPHAVKSLVIDDNFYIWLASTKGVFKGHYYSSEFELVKGINNICNNLVIGKNNTVWAAVGLGTDNNNQTTGIIFKKDSNSDTFIPVQQFDAPVYVLNIDISENVWAGTSIKEIKTSIYKQN